MKDFLISFLTFFLFFLQLWAVPLSTLESLIEKSGSLIVILLLLVHIIIFSSLSLFPLYFLTFFIWLQDDNHKGNLERGEEF